MRAYERFLKYIRVYTTSDDNSETIPSTQRQFDLGNELAQEMKALGISNVRIDDKCYVYGEIPATKGYGDRVYCPYGYSTGFFRRRCESSDHREL